MTAAQSLVVGALSPDEFKHRLTGGGLGVRLGPFDFCVRVSVPGLESTLQELYHHYPVLETGGVFSGHVSLRPVISRARPFRKVRFEVDGQTPHEDLPTHQALAVLEWGINLVVSARFHNFLLLHCAALERNGGVMLLPAAPGDGKTTLCAALAHRGWRLFSDEFGLVKPGETVLRPVPRPMPLKNSSIGVLRAFAPDAYIGPEIRGTRKGTIAHVRPPCSSIERANEPAVGRWIVFPKWESGAKLRLRKLEPSEAFVHLATNAFNYELLGEAGFSTVRDLVSTARSFQFVYSDLSEALGCLQRMADDDGP